MCTIERVLESPRRPVLECVGTLHRPNRILETYPRYESRTKRKNCRRMQAHGDALAKTLLASPAGVARLLETRESGASFGICIQADETALSIGKKRLRVARACVVASRRARGRRARLSSLSRTRTMESASSLSRRLSERREEVRNSSVQLWEKLTRSDDDSRESEPGTPQPESSSSSLQELRTCIAFNEGFPKIFAAIQQEDHKGPVARDAARSVQRQAAI